MPCLVDSIVTTMLKVRDILEFLYFAETSCGATIRRQIDTQIHPPVFGNNPGMKYPTL
jgi:hypothetical protein